MKTDKSKEITASISLINDKLHFRGTADENKEISIDYIPPLGDNLGYTSLELLLLSLSSCVGSSVLTFLRKMRKNIKSFSIESKGIRKQEHPTGFETIFLDIQLQSEDVSNDDMLKVIKLSEDTYCPVYAMLKGNVEIQIQFAIK